MDVTLLPSERNAVLDAVLESGVDPSEFAWSDVRADGDLCSRVVHSASGFYCLFALDAYTGRLALVSPGPDLRVQRVDAFDWQGQLNAVRIWLRQLVNELQPDRWSLYEDAGELADLATNSGDDGKFSRTERSAIAEQMEAAKQMLARLPGRSPEQLSAANAKLDYLVEAARQQSRRQWYFTAIGVLATIAIGMDMAVNEARSLFELVGHGMRALGVG